MVDSTDINSFVLSNKELQNLFKNDELKDAVFLVLANKKDKKPSASIEEIIRSLGLQTVTENSWNVFGVSAKNGTGIEEAFDWLIEKLQKKA